MGGTAHTNETIETDTPAIPDFKSYRRSQIASIRAYLPGELLSSRVSISAVDRDAGSPKEGDMIGRNPANHEDQWLIAKAYFEANFEPIPDAPTPAS